MYYRIINKIKDKSAQALPEFALCLPLIMLMIGILITVGQMVYAKEVLQAAAQSYCRAYVSSYTSTSDWYNKWNANRNGVAQARLIMESAALNIMLNPTVDDTYDNEVKPITGWTNSEDGGPAKKILTAKNEPYEYVEITIHGAIETLFPVQWNGNELTPNLTFLEAYCAMLIEKP